jgi:hypothetical protein
LNRDTSEVELRREVEQLRAENARLRALLDQATDRAPASPVPNVSGEPVARATLFEDDLAGLPRVDAQSPAKAKILLFRALFAGREDIHAVRWENSRTGRSGWSPALVGGPPNARRSDREYIPLTDAVIESHLTGRVHVGLYPLLRSAPGDATSFVRDPMRRSRGESVQIG